MVVDNTGRPREQAKERHTLILKIDDDDQDGREVGEWMLEGSLSHKGGGLVGFAHSLALSLSTRTNRLSFTATG